MADVTGLLVSTFGSAAAIWAYNHYGGPYGGITSPMEIKAIDIIGGAVVAGLIGYFFYGRGGLDSYDVVLSLIEGGAAVAISRLVALSGSS